MASYSIKQLEEISGIKAHTIRIWEKRYGLFNPQRTSTNIRTYRDADLKKLLNISILLNNGYKISRIAKLTDEETYDKILHSSNISEDHEAQIKNLLISTVEFDEQKFEKTLSKCIMQLGFEETFIHILYPLFYHIGLLWQTCKINPAQEHFVTQLVRQKLIVAIDSTLLKDNTDTTKFLMFLPENEFHELSLLFYHYILKKHHYKVIYLGQSVPLNDVIEVVGNNDIDYLFTSITTCNDAEKLKTYISGLASAIPDKQIIFSGQALKSFHHSYPNVQIISHPNMIQEVLGKINQPLYLPKPV
ncbi:MAG: MerR family transcriptional regulator [Bacteroidales bacterium]|nr:MerR family transcriptional regulator [Bacteroidales bacterium]